MKNKYFMFNPLRLKDGEIKKFHTFKSSKDFSSVGIDRISNLPQHLISHILSLLPTKCAVATSILSTRWRYLRTSITNLHFQHYVEVVGNYSERTSFTNFVTRVLLLLNPPPIQIFRLTITQSLIDTSCINSWVDSWISDAFGRTIREMDLYLRLNQPIRLPLRSHMISCNVAILKLFGNIHFDVPEAVSVCFPSLQTLDLCDITFSIDNNSSVSFPKLKILHLSHVDYANEDTILKLLSSCPVLDDLIIRKQHFDNVLSLVIRLPSLTRFNLIVFDSQRKEEHAYKLQIDTPALRYLYIEDVIPFEYLRPKYLSSLLEAKVKLRYIDKEDDKQCTLIFMFIESLSNVMFLSVSDFVLKVLRTLSANISPVFHNLTRLELEGHNCEDSPILINNFLGSMDNLKHLVMKGWRCNCSNKSWWTKHLNVPMCLTAGVANISFTCMRGGCRGQLELIRYFMKNAEVLQRLTMSSGICSKEKNDLFREISSYPKGSRACRVTLA